MTVRERPGIYAEYRVNGSLAATDSGITVGVAAQVNGSETETERVVSYLSAVQSYGICPMTKLIKTLFANGCGRILASPVSDDDYAAAFRALTDGGADILICDSRAADVLDDMKTALESSDYCMGVGEADGTAARCVALAEGINLERMIICAGGDETDGNIAAALAGVISSEKELFLNGRILRNAGQLERQWSEQELETLIAGGVTPVEYEGNDVCVVRGVTTKTSTEGASDRSLREIATVIAVLEVLKSVSGALKIKFARARNDALTRGAIRSQVAVELEKKLAEGRISHYGNISAVADAEDASLCRVSFEFTAVCGLSTIVLTAYLNV